jgi:hypothetical protein
MKKSKRTEKVKGIIDDLKEIAALFGVKFPEKENNLIKDISLITQSKDEICISLTRKSYLREIIDSWRFTGIIEGIYSTERELIIMLKNTN